MFTGYLIRDMEQICSLSMTPVLAETAPLISGLPAWRVQVLMTNLHRQQQLLPGGMMHSSPFLLRRILTTLWAISLNTFLEFKKLPMSMELLQTMGPQWLLLINNQVLSRMSCYPVIKHNAVQDFLQMTAAPAWRTIICSDPVWHRLKMLNSQLVMTFMQSQTCNRNQIIPCISPDYPSEVDKHQEVNKRNDLSRDSSLQNYSYDEQNLNLYSLNPNQRQVPVGNSLPDNQPSLIPKNENPVQTNNNIYKTPANNLLHEYDDKNDSIAAVKQSFKLKSNSNVELEDGMESLERSTSAACCPSPTGAKFYSAKRTHSTSQYC